jgi:hypothetical protein
MASKPGKKQPPTAAAKPFKYAKQFRPLSGCPFKADAVFNESSYRIIHGDINNPMNFQPVALIFPGRLTGRSDQYQCDCWALSMFEKMDQLKKHILKMEETVKNWRKAVGDHGVRLRISETHGKRSTSSGTGHFSFYEYADFDAKSVADNHVPIFE